MTIRDFWPSRGDAAMNEFRAGMSCLMAVVRKDRERGSVAIFVNSLRWRWLRLWAVNVARCLKKTLL
jgi:hypothetical protein